MNKNIFFPLVFFLLTSQVFSQQEKLEIDGAIQIANSEDPNPDAGTIRWSGTDFEGWNGSAWVSLTNGKDYIKDVDNNSYEIVTIGNQMWMTENLRTTRYNDSTDILLVTNNASWSMLTTPAYTWYNNDKTDYGALYNFYSVAPPTNNNKICPTGWHVPTNTEWTTMIGVLGGASAAGGKMKESGLAHWSLPNTAATNESGFRALPGGFRNTDGTFSNINTHGYWWSTTETTPTAALYRYVESGQAFQSEVSFLKQLGLSVRCVKN